MYTLCDHIEHGRQALADQIAWHRAMKPDLTDKQVADYSAGFLQGWSASRAQLAFAWGNGNPAGPTREVHSDRRTRKG